MILMNEILILTTGGTIDKIYFDAKNDYKVGKPQITGILKSVRVSTPYVIKTLMAKDSLELTDEDRSYIYDEVHRASHPNILITHGSDTMIETAKVLKSVKEKTIVLVASLLPARFKSTDAEFNIGFALAAVQILPPGVYIAMNGQLFDPANVLKNEEINRFESIESFL